MTTAPADELRTFTNLDTVRGDLLDVYADVRAALLHLPNYADEYTEHPTVALKEIGVRPTWRKTGTARRIHDALLATRAEPYVTLMVNPAAGDGKVHELYESWGYEDIGHSQPSPASPALTVMIRASR